MDELRESLSAVQQTLARIDERLAGKITHYDGVMDQLRLELDALKNKVNAMEIENARMSVKVAAGVAIAAAILHKALEVVF